MRLSKICLTETLISIGRDHFKRLVGRRTVYKLLPDSRNSSHKRYDPDRLGDTDNESEEPQLVSLLGSFDGAYN